MIVTLIALVIIITRDGVSNQQFKKKDS